jgi:hypothetical protein
MQRADNDREANGLARLFAGMAARAMSGRLDRALANGAEPSTNRLLATRAAQLTSRSTRFNVAGVLELDLHEARWFHAQDDIAPRARQRELLRASPELQQLIDRLLDDREVRAQGIARLQQLLIEDRGRINGNEQPGTLQHELKAAIDLLAG